MPDHTLKKISNWENSINFPFYERFISGCKIFWFFVFTGPDPSLSVPFTATLVRSDDLYVIRYKVTVTQDMLDPRLLNGILRGFIFTVLSGPTIIDQRFSIVPTASLVPSKWPGVSITFTNSLKPATWYTFRVVAKTQMGVTQSTGQQIKTNTLSKFPFVVHPIGKSVSLVE